MSINTQFSKYFMSVCVYTQAVIDKRLLSTQAALMKTRYVLGALRSLNFLLLDIYRFID